MHEIFQLKTLLYVVSVYMAFEKISQRNLLHCLSARKLFISGNKNTHCITLGKSTMWSESNGQLCYASYLCHMTQTEILYRTLHTNSNFAQLTSQENPLYSHCES